LKKSAKEGIVENGGSQAVKTELIKLLNENVVEINGVALPVRKYLIGQLFEASLVV
jgi:hypothetical protein